MTRFAAKLSKIQNLLYARDIRWGDRRGAGRSKESRNRYRAVFFALVMILWLPITGVAAIGAVGAQGPPDNAGNGAGGADPGNNGGGPPDHAGERGPPDHAAVNNVEVGGGNGNQERRSTAGSGSGGPPTHAEAWNVSASHSAESLEVFIDIGDGSGDELNLRLTDNEVHEGREVAVDADAVESAVGERPATVYGRHAETGEGWTSAVEYESGSAIFEVPHFSTQDVTFSGGISLSGDKATNGTTYEYDLNSLDSVSDYSINLTGVENTRDEIQSWQHAAGGGSTFDVGGNIDPNNAYVNLKGVRDETNQSKSVSDGDTVDVGGNVDPINEQVSVSGTETRNTRTETYTVHAGGLDQANFTIPIDGNTYPRDVTVEVVSASAATTTVDDPGNSDSTWTADVGFQSIDSYGPYEKEIGACNDYDWNYTIEGEYMGETSGSTYGDCATDSTTISHTFDSGTATSTDGTFTFDPNFAHGQSASQTVDVKSVEPAGISFNAVGGGSTESVGVGQSASLDMEGADGEIEVNTDSGEGPVEVEVTYDDVTGTKDATVDIDGNTVTYSGYLGDDTYTENVDLSIGSHPVSASSTEGLSDITVKWDRVDQTEDPAVDIAGKTVYHSGYLSPNETVTEPISITAGESYSVDVAGGEHEVIVETNWTETTTTEDASISVNGETVSHSGQLSDGETVSLTTDESWIEEGSNTVEIGLADVNGPTPMVGFNYQHSADSASKTADVNATAWHESYVISNTFASQQDNATATLPFSGNVIGLTELRVRENGGQWTEPAESDIEWIDNGPQVELALGTLAAETTIEIEAEARKIDVTSGAVDVTNPTIGGDKLKTEFEVTDDAGENAVVIDVSETSAANPEYVHYLSSSSWDNAATMQTDGSRMELVMPEANTGGTATAETLPFVVNPASGTAEIGIENVMLEDGGEEQLQFTMSGTVTSTEHEVIWHDTVEGQEYVLYSDSTDIEVDTATPSSPAYLYTDGSEQTYTIIERDERAALGGGGGAVEGSGLFGSIPILGAILAGGPVTGVFLFLFGLAGIVLLARGVGGQPRGQSGGGVSLRSIRSLSLPSRSTLLSPSEWSLPSLSGDSGRSTRQRTSSRDEGNELIDPTTAIVLAAIAGLTLVLLELSTPRSLTGTAIYGFLSGGFVSILSAIGVLLVVWAINEQTESDIPLPVNAGIAIIVLIWVLETLAPGVIVDALAGGLEDVSAIIWISLIGGGGYLIYRWLQRRDSGGGGGETRIMVDTGGEN